MFLLLNIFTKSRSVTLLFLPTDAMHKALFTRIIARSQQLFKAQKNISAKATGGQRRNRFCRYPVRAPTALCSALFVHFGRWRKRKSWALFPDLHQVSGSKSSRRDVRSAVSYERKLRGQHTKLPQLAPPSLIPPFWNSGPTGLELLRFDFW